MSDRNDTGQRPTWIDRGEAGAQTATDTVPVTHKRGIIRSTSRNLGWSCEEQEMHETERRLRAMINPWSSAFTRWWCHSTARYILTGYGRGSGRVAQADSPARSGELMSTLS